MASQITDAFRGATAQDIVSWTRPIASGIILGSFLAVWFVYVYFGYTATTFTCRVVQCVFIAGAAARLTRRVPGSPTDLTARLDSLYAKARPTLHKGIQTSFRLLTWETPITSAKAFLLTFVIALLGNWMSDMVLLLLVVVAIFALPKVYQQNKTVIDQNLKKVTDILDKYLGRAQAKGAELKKAAEDSMKKRE